MQMLIFAGAVLTRVVIAILAGRLAGHPSFPIAVGTVILATILIPWSRWPTGCIRVPTTDTRPFLSSGGVGSQPQATADRQPQ